MSDNKVDEVNHPIHYNKHPSGVECIEITRHMNNNLGNAIKYVWRAGEKGDGVEFVIKDLNKAVFYLKDEIERLKESETKSKKAEEVKEVSKENDNCDRILFGIYVEINVLQKRKLYLMSIDDADYITDDPFIYKSDALKRINRALYDLHNKAIKEYDRLQGNEFKNNKVD
jgi:hypothetical protein